ncbi:glutamine synthetase family protein [Streptomyces sp. NBC_00285]|uniref:glutamine synthetase family protein n=1 Tax=Streptomyces sp. NBC_00285 TaxID=2975700 RepID=UPI002E29F1BF|nr:glutamine synthetase family protein [Streptomyces sp. NBC_00285]
MSSQQTDESHELTRLAGFISAEEFRTAVDREDITTVMVCVPDMMGRLKGKRLSARVFLDRIADGLNVTEACAYILATNVGMDPLGGFDLTGWDKGFQDLGMVADLATLRVLPYMPGLALVHCEAVQPDGTPLEIAPRRMLRTQLDRLGKLGFEARVGLESEFVLCNGLQPMVQHNLDYALDHPPALSDFFRYLEDALPEAGVPIEAAKTEGAPGQVEITFPYGPALQACDDYTVYKQTVQHLARRQALSATFMSAPFTGVGSGLHLHLSLWKDGVPAFDAVPGAELPETMRHSIAGLLSGMPHLAPLYAPNPNSYKRYATAHSFAPQYMNWGHDNRGCAVRVTGHGEGTHLEIRLPGADANPYLALAASVAAIVHGLTEKLNPPAPCRGDAYADRQTVPVLRDLAEALAYFHGSDFATSALGAEVVRHYAIAAEAEIAEHRRQVTDVERERWFDRA